MAVSGTGVAAGSIGLLFLWSAIKGASVSDSLRSIISGKAPSGQNVNPINLANLGAGTAAAGASAGLILGIASSYKGEKYCFGGGHGSSPAPKGKCTDCSGYVSQVMNEAGLMHGTMTTSGLAHIGTSIPYDQRQPGDIIVWTGAPGHCGIIIDNSTMWNNPCTACGGVQISHYPYGSRTAAAANIRRLGR